ncbi:MAG TPA: bifunctional proline dehydrogenase/L-glutamate gamma-semialdehyde dehydrogenase [Acidimicrobiales bacterium]|nr:bifunctional proline dehydrogenase/L-glutamate gamma-semialdehyde dehydrogenase [Acidimicrobiales bacterium]
MSTSRLDEDVAVARKAVELAAELIATADRRSGRRDRRRLARMARMLDDDAGRRTLIVLLDEVARIPDTRRAARRLADLVEDEGVPGFLGPLDRVAFGAGARLARRFHRLVLPLVQARVRRETAGVILPAEDPAFARYVSTRTRQGVRLNVNVLGEAVLGDGEARRRLDAVIERLRRPDVDYVSVKLSAIAAQLNIVAFDATIERVAERLRRLYAAAMAFDPPKFVNLDMEEYRDLRLTTTVFRRVLDEPRFRALDAGIVLQAYLPDSHDALVELCEWARDRRAAGGGRIRVRLVKGANLAMERVEAELRGWPQAPYGYKSEVDASYKRMLDTALDERWADAVVIGLASHNLFDVAWALVQRDVRGACGRLEIEMLEGMAPPQAAATRDAAGSLLLYAPVVREDDFSSAIAYLIRRFDENTAPENYLRSLFSLDVGSPAFDAECARFLQAVSQRRTVPTTPRRTQDRNRPDRAVDDKAPFANEPDTDFSLPANREWLHRELSAWTAPALVCPVVDGDEVDTGRHVTTASPNRPDRPFLTHAVADAETVDRAVAVARRAGPAWAARRPAERRRILARVAHVMAECRGETLAAMAHEAGKTVLEGDPEVSEACDFARYYAASTRDIETLVGDGLTFEPLGTVVVASPWNFPYAIPAGGVLAGLAAGNAVILKPAPEAVLTASLVARHCWAAGVPRDVLQLVPCADDEVGRRLVTHPDVDAVILTGAYETARLFLEWRPDLRLHAETSGKNAIVVTAAADIDAAVRDIVQSAFGHGGQKCSAASLAIVEAAVHDDPAFRRQLADAASTLVVGPADDLRSVVGPLVRPPAGPLADALSALDPGEQWLLEPRSVDGNPHLWSPGIKLGVRPGSWFHRTECFGPVLGVMRARSLDEAIAWQNDTGFGLTGGLHSLDPHEIERWTARVEVGNAYVNRGITGAIVQRQPFGGWKRSVVGPTAKAGGPNYVLSLGRWRNVGAVDDVPYRRSLDYWWKREFAVERDPTALAAERNVLRYRPLPAGVLLRVGDGVPEGDVQAALTAAEVAGTPVVVSRRADEDDEAVAERLRAGACAVDRVRVLGTVDPVVRLAAADAGVVVDDSPVVRHGRIELLHWVREQAVSETRHRHGNLMPDRPRPPAVAGRGRHRA